MTQTTAAIRNIAIIAHVDHGKTTLVDQLFRQSGLFRDNQDVAERLMDSIDQERERGITIMAKNGSCLFEGYRINIIDTPGHADFGGQVEAVLKMANGVLLVVDAAEGPMPQTHFVLQKALAQNLKVIVVINKIDKPAARPEWVVDQVFDLMVRLNAPDDILDFPVIYASAKQGYAQKELQHPSENMKPLFQEILASIPAPNGDPQAQLQLQVSSVTHNSFLGRLAVGRVFSGSLAVNQDALFGSNLEHMTKTRITKIYTFLGNQMQETDQAVLGDIVAVAGMESAQLGDTLTSVTEPQLLPCAPLDPPTLSMRFLPNDSPFSGREGEFVTSRHLQERLQKELLVDAALKVEELVDTTGFEVSGRGELHLSVLIEKMRREGYELQVTRPHVIERQDNGQRLEPFEELILDFDEAYLGAVMELWGDRKAQMLDMTKDQGRAQLRYRLATRALLGMRSEYLTETRGTGTMHSLFLGYEPHVGELRSRKNGVLISSETGATVAYALFNLKDRGRFFLEPGVDIYEGQILGQHCREGDLVVNATKAKKLTNMRAAGSDDNVLLPPPLQMSLEDYLTFLEEDELLEVTPKSTRLRKKHLNETDRKRASRSANS